MREALHSAPSLSEFLCSSSSGCSLSLLPAVPAAFLLQVRTLGDRTPIGKSPGTSMPSKMIINFGLQGAVRC